MSIREPDRRADFCRPFPRPRPFSGAGHWPGSRFAGGQGRLPAAEVRKKRVPEVGSAEMLLSLRLYGTTQGRIRR